MLDEIRLGIKAVLGDQLMGMYIHGSLVLGDFVPGRSDIDFVVATAEDLPAQLLPALKKMHADIGARHLKSVEKC